MPWKEGSVVDERLRFVAQLLDGEAMSEVCRAFGISRKTGYKIFERYKEHGLEALTDRSRRPVRYANPLPRQIESLIVAAKRDKPHLGCPQDPRAPGPPTGRRHPRSRQEHDPRRAPPARPGQDPGTAAAPGDRHAALDRRCAKRPLVRRFQEPAPAKAGGEFKLGNGRYCFPLTVTDHASRFLLLCEALESTRENLAITAFEQLFQERGLPQAIRSDNGVPFASPNGLFNLSKLSVWWLRLGIAIERIKPGHPQQNGRHERMHLTLNKEATRPPGNEQPAATGPLRRLCPGIQHRTATRGARHEVSGRNLLCEFATLLRPARSHIPVARPRSPRHCLRPHLLASQGRQCLNRASRSAPRHQGGR